MTVLEQARAVLKKHQQARMLERGSETCMECKQRWPCDARVMAGYIDAWGRGAEKGANGDE